MANSIAQLLVKIGLDSSQFGAGLDRMSQRAKRFGDEMKAAGTTMTLAITAPMLGLGAAAIKTAGEMEQASVAFTTLLKSSTAAAEHLKELKAFALTTPFQFTDLTRLSRLMRAYGFSAQEVVPKLRTMGNAVSALGGGSDVLERVIRSMGEIGTRGKITGEQLRELARAGIPALQAVADKLGVSVAEAQAKITAGTVDAKTASEALLEYMDKRFKGGMEAQSKTLLGLFSNVKDQITFTLTAVGDALLPLGKSLVQNYIQPALEGITNLANAFKKLPQPIQEAALAFGGVAVSIPLVIVAMGTMISNGIVIAAFMAKLSAALFGGGGLIAGLGATAMAMTGMGTAATALYLTLYAGLAIAIGKLIADSYQLIAAWNDMEAANQRLNYQMDRLSKHLQAVGFDLSKIQPPKEEEITKWDLFWAAVSGSVFGTGDYKELEAKVRRQAEAIRKYQLELQKLAMEHGATVRQMSAEQITDAERNAKALDALNIRSTEQRKKDLAEAKKYYADLKAAGIEGPQAMADAAQRVKTAQEALTGVVVESTGGVRDLRKEYDQMLIAYQQGKVSSLDLARAQKNLAEAQSDASGIGKELATVWRKFFEIEDGGTAVEERRLEVTKKLYKEVETARENAQKSLKVQQEMQQLDAGVTKGISLEAQALYAMERALDDGVVGVEKTHTSVTQLARSMEEAESSSKTLGQGVKDMAQQSAEAIKTLPPIVQASMGSLLTFTGPLETAFEKAAAALHLSVAEISGEVTTKTLDAFKTFAAGAKTVEQVNMAWAAASQTIGKLSKYDLPGAVSAYQVYIEALRRTGATETELARATIALQEMRIRAAQEAGQKIAASEFILLDVMKRRLEQEQFNWGEFFNKLVSGLERSATQSLSRVTVDAILGGGIVDHQKLDASLKAAQDAYDALLKMAQDAADQEMDVQRAYSAWQIAQQRLDAFKGANITAEKRAELQRQVNDAKAAYDRIRQNFITNYRGMTQATRDLKEAQRAATDPSAWERFTGTVKALFEDLGKAALHVIVEELAQIGIGKLIASLGRLIPGIGKIIAQYGAMGAAGKAAGKLIEEAMKRVKEEMDQITTKAPIMGTALTTAFTSATTAAVALSVQLGVIIAQLAAIIIEANAAAIALRNMAAANSGGGGGGGDIGDFFRGLFGGGAGLGSGDWGTPDTGTGIGSPVTGGARTLAATHHPGIAEAMASITQLPALALAGAGNFAPAATVTTIRGGDLHVHFNGTVYGGAQGRREIANHIFADQRRRSGR